MDAGKLNKRIAIQTRSTVTDEGGGKVETWTTASTVWASVKPKAASPVLVAAMPQQTQTHEIIIRYRADVTKRNRLLFDGRVLEIESTVNVDEAGDFLKISCIESGV